MKIKLHTLKITGISDYCGKGLQLVQWVLHLAFLRLWLGHGKIVFIYKNNVDKILSPVKISLVTYRQTQWCDRVVTQLIEWHAFLLREHYQFTFTFNLHHRILPKPMTPQWHWRWIPLDLKTANWRFAVVEYFRLQWRAGRK